MIIATDLTDEQRCLLMALLKKHKKATAWKISDIKGISPTVCMHRIQLEDNTKNNIEIQRRLKLIMKYVVKKDITKWLDTGILYLIFDNVWVGPIQRVLKKDGMTVIENEQNKFIPIRTIIGWRICMDYRNLNKVIRKDHFPFPFIDQMLDRLVGKEFYYFLDGYSDYSQITIAL